MGVIKDPAGAGEANVVDHDNPVTTGKKALLVVPKGADSKLQDGSGNPLTSTDEGGGVRALDVHIQGGSQNPTATEGAAIGSTGTPLMGKDASGNAEFLPIAEEGQSSPLKGFLVMGTDDTTLRAQRVRSNGSARVEMIYYLYNIAAGIVPNHSVMFRNVDATLPTTNRQLLVKGVWNEQSTGAQRSLVSDSSQDSATGTGARKVLLTYISSVDGTRKTEVVTLNGTTAVDTVATDIKWVDQLQVIDAGSGQLADGTISLMSATAGGGTTMAQIVAGESDLRAAVIYAPSNRTVYMSRVFGTSDDRGIYEFVLQKDWSSKGGVTLPDVVMKHYYEKKALSDFDLPVPIKIDPGKKLEVYLTPANPGAFVAGTFVGWEEQV